MKTRDAVPRLWCWVLGECEGVHVCLNDIHISNISIYIYMWPCMCVCDDLYIFQDVKDLKKNMKLYTHVTVCVH